MNATASQALPPAWTALAIAVTIAAEMTLGRWLRARRLAGNLSFGAAPVLDLPVADILAVVGALALSIYWPGGIWFGLVGAAAVAAVVRLNGIPLRRHFGPGRLTLPGVAGLSLWIALAVFVPLQLLAGGCQLLFQHFGWPTPAEPAVDLFLHAEGWRPLAILFFAATVVAPFGEETLFRGFLQPLLRRHLPPWGAIGITALLFAALHQHPLTLLPLFVFGLVLGFAYELSGSLLLCMGLHFWFNAFTALLLIAGYGPQ